MSHSFLLSTNHAVFFTETSYVRAEKISAAVKMLEKKK